ncbi:MAG: RluA family pseudouridine synthase [Vagococcus sp.]|uniref:RluA family pseudouridine synthase n=1 Tax=Vagococcus sp. TaxID=1933889 RepID=UPI002FCBA1FE
MKNKKNNTNLSKSDSRASKYIVEKEIELLPFLLETLKGLSRNSVKSILTRGQVSINGKVVTKHNHPLIEGTEIIIQDNKAAMKENALVGLQIIHEDADVLVIEKDAGLLSVATDKGPEVTVYSQLMNYVRQTNPKNRIFVVHRLDRDTSGVMLFAKNEKTKKILQENWKELVLERIYTAVVEGNVKENQKTITSWLTESKTFKIHSCPFNNGGKKAITHYKKVRGNQTYSMLEVNLETGRKNQIRVHMEEIGHPIVGDKKYGAHSNPLKRLGLHATTLVFIHPTTKKRMKFTSKVPKKFTKLTIKEKE